MADTAKTSQTSKCQTPFFICLFALVLSSQLYIICTMQTLMVEITKLDGRMKQISVDVKFGQPYSNQEFTDLSSFSGEDTDDSSSTNEGFTPPHARDANATGYESRCNITEPEALSAISRAKTDVCKQKLADISCLNQEGKLIPASLPRSCPIIGIYAKGTYLGCFRDVPEARDVGNHLRYFKDDNTPERCIEFCINGGYAFAAVEFSIECWCGFEYGHHGSLPESSCSLSCPGNRSQSCGGYTSLRVFSTGLRHVERFNDVRLVYHPEEARAYKPIRIVFSFMVSGRAVRQLKQLIKAIYHRDHYYYIHVDKKQEYLYQELRKLEDIFPNLRLAKNRLTCMWGGSALLMANLELMRSLLDMTDWVWDYYINLSESAYPIKNITALTDFIRLYQGANFIEHHGADTYEFVDKQGVGELFYECERHVWKMGQKRALPSGIVMDGGSDWFGLHRDFIEYVINSDDKLISGLLEFGIYSFSPLESFFHMVLLNSKFCETIIDININVINWIGPQGCSCVKRPVDWCGCSPKSMTAKDLDFLMSHANFPVFLARKFEAVVSQEIYNSLDKVLGITYEDTSKLKFYWQNDFNPYDKLDLRTNLSLTFGNSFMRRASIIFEENKQTCDYVDMQMIESHILCESDKFQSYLIQHTLLMPDETVCRYESRFTKINHFKREASITANGRLQYLEVGSDYDSREKIFRNYPGFFAPETRVVLRHFWSYGPGKKVTFTWIDPDGKVAAMYDLRIARTRLVQVHNPKLRRPLQYGIWTVKISLGQTVLGKVDFLILPLDMNQSFSASKDGQCNSESYEYSANLLNHVDYLTSKFWKLQETCLISSDEVCPVLKPCQDTIWSSVSPDPKSDIEGIDKNGDLIYS